VQEDAKNISAVEKARVENTMAEAEKDRDEASVTTTSAEEEKAKKELQLKEADRLENERKQAAEQAKENAKLERERVAAEGAEKAAIRAEVESLIQETKSPRTADELLEEYNGKEDELLTNLREKKAKQIAEEDETKESRAKKDAVATATAVVESSDAKVTPDDEIAKMDKMERVRLKMEKAKSERAEYMAFMKSQA
jgi:hypothetical protein